jgi:ATPase subunit of ABC transporter with duplicated ATPase domains
VLTVDGLQLRAGARLLLTDATFLVRPGDRIGLVGRNGAGKTTLCRVLAGEALPAAGAVRRTGTVGYLPQDPRTGELAELARDRILSARGLAGVLRQLARAQDGMAAGDERSIRHWADVEEQFRVLGGYAAESEAATIAASLGLPDRVLGQPLGTLSGGQRRRVELARILFGGSETMLLDEPTNHLDADSIAWLREHLRAYRGGLVVISHDVGLLEAVANRILHIDATNARLDVYNVGWREYLQQRAVDERRRHRERATAERKASALLAQADRMRAKATKARAAHNMQRRANRLLADRPELLATERTARIRFPTPAPCGRMPLAGEALAKSYGSLEVFEGVDMFVDRGSRTVVLGLNGAGKTTLLRLLVGLEPPDSGSVRHGHGLRLGYYAQEHEGLDPDATVLTNLRAVAPATATEPELRRVLGAFLFSGDLVDQLAGTLSGGEKTRLALARLVVSSANVLLLDEPTNNLDPVSREQVLAALASYRGAVVLVTHDLGAVQALAPQRVLLLPDGVEDSWSEDLADLVALA